jgi:predicted membrane chloride channel (bestrophin family)
MITYNRSAFGFNLLFRVSGSAVYRSVFPSLFSVAIYFLVHFQYSTLLPSYLEEKDLGHPYAIGVLVGSVTFLIVFRANQGYARYWEGAGASHVMMSKFMDATMHTGVYHLQCKHYEDIKPPSYFDYPELNHLFLTRDRERGADYYPQPGATESDDGSCVATNPERANTFPLDNSRGLDPPGGRNRGSFVTQLSIDYQQKVVSRQSLKEKRKQQLLRSKIKTINSLTFDHRGASGGSTERSFMTYKSAAGYVSSSMPLPDIGESESVDPNAGFQSSYVSHFLDDSERLFGKTPTPLVGEPRMDGNWSRLYKTKQVFFAVDDNTKGFASIEGGRTPPLFLQELAHLSSLLVAVAFSTLRNDMEGFESPLSFFVPGTPWPEVDPDRDELLRGRGFKSLWENLLVFLGMGRSDEDQTKYNAARPFPVIGGVSDAEIKFLQMARGPYAKTMLCWNWLSEFVIREHLAGTLGDVGPPIISRIIQFLGDGMIHYNHSRKIMFIPFPFPHAQLSVLFIVVLIPCVPFLMDQYVEEAWLAASLTFFTVLCLSGIHEVARDLENPFRNVPNEIPLVTMLAQYNEALVTMYSGWHPDHFWDGEKILQQHNKNNKNDLRESLKRSHPKAFSTPPSAPILSSSSPEQAAEIAELKRQLQEQSRIIQKLSDKISFDPDEEIERMDRENSFHPRYNQSNDTTPLGFIQMPAGLSPGSRKGNSIRKDKKTESDNNDKGVVNSRMVGSIYGHSDDEPYIDELPDTTNSSEDGDETIRMTY